MRLLNSFTNSLSSRKSVWDGRNALFYFGLMKKENLEILQRIQSAIEKIVASECESIYVEHKSNQQLLFQMWLDIKRIQKEKEQIEKSNKYRENYAWRLRQVVDLLASDWVIELICDWDSWFDEYGNWWWYQVEFAKYKDEQIELQYDSF